MIINGGGKDGGFNQGTLKGISSTSITISVPSVFNNYSDLSWQVIEFY